MVQNMDHWLTISSSAACLVNNDKIQPSDQFKSNSLEDCKLVCEYRSSCSAIDYYSVSKECVIYTGSSCSSPLDSADGGASYRFIRMTLSNAYVSVATMPSQTIIETDKPCGSRSCYCEITYQNGS